MGKKARLKKIKQSRPAGAFSKEPLEGGIVSGPLQKALFVGLIIALLIVGIALRVKNIDGVQFRSPDEGVYTYQANVIAQRGVEGSRALLKEYNEDGKMWVFPHPLRVNYLFLLAGFMKAINVTDVMAGSYLSSFFSVCSLLLLVIIGVRYFNRQATLYGLLFLAVSPMSLAIARRSWQEAMLGCLGLLFIFICCEIMRRPKRIILYLAGVALGSYLLLVKLSGWVSYALCMAWMLWVLLAKERSPLKSLLLIIIAAIGAGVMLGLLLHLTGGLPAIKELIIHKKSAMASNIYAIEYCSGPWYRFFNMLWILTPVNLILFAAGIGFIFFDTCVKKTGLLQHERAGEAVPAIALFLVTYMALLFIFKRYPQNLRYISSLYAPFYLICGLGFWRVLSLITKKAKGLSLFIIIGSAASALIFTAVNDYKNFDRIIVKTGIKDLSIKLIEEAEAGLYNR